MKEDNDKDNENEKDYSSDEEELLSDLGEETSSEDEQDSDIE